MPGPSLASACNCRQNGSIVVSLLPMTDSPASEPAPDPPPPTTRAAILQVLTERLMQSLVSGPVLNARPHFSRQRLDLQDLAALGNDSTETLLQRLLRDGRVEIPAQIPAMEWPSIPFAKWPPEKIDALEAWRNQQSVLSKLRTIAADAADYVGDHGESALALGCPLLSLPPQRSSNGKAPRVLAPLAFVPVELQVRGKGSVRPGVVLSLAGAGSSKIVPNEVLLTFLERETGLELPIQDLDDDPPDSMAEIAALTSLIQKAAGLPDEAILPWDGQLSCVPKTEDLPKEPALLHGAVLGLFPMHNSGLLRDMEWMQQNEANLELPTALFLDPRALGGAEETEAQPTTDSIPNASKAQEEAHLIAPADPCQATAVWQARSSRALIIHGPPGTGKSQTIANIIGDHLSLGQRVLFVSDKRTALDVVKHRLDALGIGDLCGIVHDATADRTPLYMGLRARLDALTETATTPSRMEENAALHARWLDCRKELFASWAALHRNTDGHQPFHDAAGDWFEIRSMAEAIAPDLDDWPGKFALVTLEAHSAALDEIMRRACRIHFSTNPWRGWPPANPDELATVDLSKARDVFESIKAAPPTTAGNRLLPLMQLDAAQLALAATALQDTAVELGDITLLCDDDLRRRYAEADPNTLRGFIDQAERLATAAVGLVDTPLDPLLFSNLSEGEATLAEINQRLVAIKRWNDAQGLQRWFRFLHAGTARRALTPLGLDLTDSDASRGKSFYQALQIRLALGRELGGSLGAMPADDVLAKGWRARKLLGGLLARFLPGTPLAGCDKTVREAIGDPHQVSTLVHDLDAAARRLNEGEVWLQKLRSTGIFAPNAEAALIRAILDSADLSQLANSWADSIDTTPDLARIQELLDSLPETLGAAANHAAIAELPWDKARVVLRSCALSTDIRQMLASNPLLSRMDGDRIESAFAELRELAAKRRTSTRHRIIELWATRQRDRLLASTGSRMNPMGAALKQRLFIRGAKALRMRSMIAAGADIEGGDPLFDLCPVWMAAPSTVAQIMPRQALFDVVIFDEASQCRLEETLPVLLRANRVVIAGDQQQLPPTRFFEASVQENEDSVAGTADDLFEKRQTSAEDLLTAALNLPVDEAFLDVHYRSKNEALIAYSNQAFYQGRLQTMPPTLHDTSTSPALCLHEIAGTYKDRTNADEANAVVNLVRDLLSQSAAPSIGVACFNLSQRDLINEALENLASTDATFAEALTRARALRSDSTFEGLFVRNLENVQGDERDVMIISTTFGPDPNGVFRRLFGALNRPGGGRRLNVLVTRARRQVHVFTSIPRSEFAALPPIPPGTEPGGRYHLYAYLAHALNVSSGSIITRTASHGDPDSEPFKLGTALAAQLRPQITEPILVGWGSEGLAIDAAFAHSKKGSIGVMVDFSRYRQAGDAIAWDMFRHELLTTAGWTLRRVWSPDIFRRPRPVIESILA